MLRTLLTIAMVCARVPAVRVRVRLRRRKGERELRVTLAAEAQADLTSSGTVSPEARILDFSCAMSCALTSS